MPPLMDKAFAVSPTMPAARRSRGDLQEVLSGWHPQNGELVLLYPSRRGVPPAVKALIEFLPGNTAAAGRPLTAGKGDYSKRSE